MVEPVNVVDGPLIVSSSMGLAGVRTPDNMAFFDAKRPQAVVYFDVDYERNPKGQH